MINLDGQRARADARPSRCGVQTYRAGVSDVSTLGHGLLGSPQFDCVGEGMARGDHDIKPLAVRVRQAIGMNGRASALL